MKNRRLFFIVFVVVVNIIVIVSLSVFSSLVCSKSFSLSLSLLSSGGNEYCMYVCTKMIIVEKL